MDAYLGEVRAFAFGWFPQNWRPCDGSTLSVQDFQALYSILGNLYGGDTKNFALPNLQSLTIIGAGTRTGLTPRVLAKTYGESSVALDSHELPYHNHGMVMQVPNGINLIQDTSAIPVANESWLARAENVSGEITSTALRAYIKSTGQSPDTTLHPNTVSFGGGQNGLAAGHENRQPYLVLQYCICYINGSYPVRPN
jgi:microcystin-dependent protein